MVVNATWEQKERIAIAQISGRIDSAALSVFQGALESGLHGDNRIGVLDFEQVNISVVRGVRFPRTRLFLPGEEEMTRVIPCCPFLAGGGKSAVGPGGGDRSLGIRRRPYA